MTRARIVRMDVDLVNAVAERLVVETDDGPRLTRIPRGWVLTWQGQRIALGAEPDVWAKREPMDREPPDDAERWADRRCVPWGGRR